MIKVLQYSLATTVSKVPHFPLAEAEIRPLLGWPELPFLIAHVSG